MRRGRITIEKVQALNPCDRYTTRHLKKLLCGRKYITYRGIAALDISWVAKLWLLRRLMTERQQHIFNCDCAERVLLIADDERCDQAIAVKRKWIEGNSTDEELCAARDVYRAAWDAWDARAAAAARDAARAARAAWDTRDAARAALEAAREAAWAATRDTTSAVAGAASNARAAVWYAARAARDDWVARAASDAEATWQINRAVKILERIQ